MSITARCVGGPNDGKTFERLDTAWDVYAGTPTGSHHLGKYVWGGTKYSQLWLWLETPGTLDSLRLVIAHIHKERAS